MSSDRAESRAGSASDSVCQTVATPRAGYCRIVCVLVASDDETYGQLNTLGMSTIPPGPSRARNT
jgi:hypothetical protein